MNENESTVGLLHIKGFVQRVISNVGKGTDSSPFTALNIRAEKGGGSEQTFFIDAVGFGAMAVTLSTIPDKSLFECLGRMDRSQGTDGQWRLRAVCVKILSETSTEEPLHSPETIAAVQAATPKDKLLDGRTKEGKAQRAAMKAKTNRTPRVSAKVGVRNTDK